MIEVERDNDSANTKKKYADFDDISGKANITEKGKFYLDFSFIYTEWGYVFAIDTPMPRDLADDSGFLKVDESQLDFASEDKFFDAFLTTIPTFARIVKHFHQMQMERVKSALFDWNHPDFTSEDMQELKDAMALPNAFVEMIVRSVRMIIDQKYKRIHSVPRKDGQKEDAKAALDASLVQYLNQLRDDQGVPRTVGASARRSENLSADSQSKTFAASEHTLAIILGASRFPHAPELDNKRFAQSAQAIKDYFCGSAQLGLPTRNCLWLFDQPETPLTTYEKIEEFLAVAMKRSKQQQPMNLIVYYIGHGFFDDGNNYYLTAQTHKNGEPDYSYRFRNLQKKIKNEAHCLRKYYLIDACFSAAALKEMMATSVNQQIIAEVKEEAKDDLPNSGTALLAASPPDDVAFAPHSHDYTLFTGAIVDVLNKTSHTQELTLGQLYQQTRNFIQTHFQEYGVLPEIHRPEQKQGDITTIPLFRGCRKVHNYETV